VRKGIVTTERSLAQAESFAESRLVDADINRLGLLAEPRPQGSDHVPAGPPNVMKTKVGRTPRSARVPLDPLFGIGNFFNKPTRASVADQGVRPT
jgi:hypothetical protein